MNFYFIHAMEKEEEIHTKFRGERKSLQAQITAMKKSASSGDKKKKKEVLEKIAAMEADLEQRYQNELETMKSVENTTMATNAETSNTPANENFEEKKEKSFYNPKDGKRPSKQQRRKERKNAEITRVREEIAAEDPLIDRKNIELAALIPKLKKQGLKIHEIPSDGHCLFNAISHQLDIHTAEQRISMRDLRKLAVKHIRSHQDDYLPFLPYPSSVISDEDIQSHFLQYCESMENGSAWGGEMEIRALALGLPVKTINVVQAQGPIIEISGQSSSSVTLYISYHKHQYGLGAHYNSLIPE